MMLPVVSHWHYTTHLPASVALAIVKDKLESLIRDTSKEFVLTLANSYVATGLSVGHG